MEGKYEDFVKTQEILRKIVVREEAIQGVTVIGISYKEQPHRHLECLCEKNLQLSRLHLTYPNGRIKR